MTMKGRPQYNEPIMLVAIVKLPEVTSPIVAISPMQSCHRLIGQHYNYSIIFQSKNSLCVTKSPAYILSI